jgi:hypothetical protein
VPVAIRSGEVVGPPPFEAVVSDLRLVREKGLGNLRRYATPALHAACGLCDLLTDTAPEPAAVEALLRKAIEGLGGGRTGEAAEYTFGLVQGTKLWIATERRKAAAKAQGVSTERFRKGYEGLLIEQVAEGILASCHERTMREARVKLERRHPADSRLAVHWVERFEAYYRVWTAAWRLGADLEAAVTTYRDEPQGHLPWEPNGTEPYDPIDQAQGYARFALYAFAAFLLEVRKFMVKHGGLWLLSDAETEYTVADAVYRIGWHNPLNDEEHSWLRRTLAEAKGEEQAHFRHLLLSTAEGSFIHKQWQVYVASCHCHLDEPEPCCQVHQTIAACKEYCELVDGEWLKIADWYHPVERPRHGVEGQQLFNQLLGRQRSSTHADDAPGEATPP